MENFRARTIIEALRSGISSRAVGETFSSARPGLLRRVERALEDAASREGSSSRDGSSRDITRGGMVVTGKYGEGKTHLLNTALSIAHRQNMAVAMITLSKETPLSNMPLLYAKALRETYLPGQYQPGVSYALEQLSPGAAATSALLEYCLTSLTTNKLYYVLKCYLATQDEEEKYLLLADMEGDFMPNAQVKRIYRRIYGDPAEFNESFVKSRHILDYFKFLSYFLKVMDYQGWALLFDEAELIGRLGRKTRFKAYENMDALLRMNERQQIHSFAMFTFNASYVPDVIESKREWQALEDAGLDPLRKEAVTAALRAIEVSPQLQPLEREEILAVLGQLLQCHAEAFGWQPPTNAQALFEQSDGHGYLLRTRIRAAVEVLDQLYQYNRAGPVTVGAVEELSLLDEYLADA